MNFYDVVGRFLRMPLPLRLLVNIYPPLAGSGIRVTGIAKDWTSGTVEMSVRFWNANGHGAAFGGSLFSITDLLFGTLVMGQLGENYESWTKSAAIDYLAPGRGRLISVMEVSAETTKRIREATADGRSLVTQHTAEIWTRDRSTLVAVAHHNLYTRRRDLPRVASGNRGDALHGDALLAAARSLATIAARGAGARGPVTADTELSPEGDIAALAAATNRCSSVTAQSVVWLWRSFHTGFYSTEDLLAANIPRDTCEALAGTADTNPLTREALHALGDLQFIHADASPNPPAH